MLLRRDQTGESGAARRAAALIDLAERQVQAGQFDRAVTSAMECRVVVQRAEALGSTDVDDADAAAALLLAQMAEPWIPTQTAVAAARDAVRLYRRLAEAGPSESPDKPATALEALASLLSSRAQAWEAIACLHDAVSIRTQLAAGDDTEALRALARLLRTPATRYEAIDETGSTEPGNNLAQAIAAAREASTVSGRIRDQELKGAELAASAQRLSTLLAKIPDQLREALSTAVLAVSLYRNLNGPSPDRYGAPLAGALHWLSLVHRRVGNADPAWRAAAESVDRYRDTCARRPEHRTYLISALRNLAQMGPDIAGRLVPLREVVNLYEALNSENPNTYDGALLNALDNLVAVLSEGGRLYRDELRVCRAKADDLRQHLHGTTGPDPSS